LRDGAFLEYKSGKVGEVASLVNQLAEFWQRPFRMIQFSLRVIDARGLDARRLVEQVIDYGANAMLINAGGILAWYPTRLPHHPVNEYLSGDLLGQVVREAHRQGVKVLVRLDVSRADPDDHDDRTGAFQVSADGGLKRDGTMLLTCFQGPYWQERSFLLVDEILSRYPVDGFYFDHLFYDHCTCRRCREAFREKTGLELPWHENWSDPWWRVYVHFRRREVADLVERLRSFIRRRNPKAILAANFTSSGDAYQVPSQPGWMGPHLADAVDVIAAVAPNSLPDEAHLPRHHLWPGQGAGLGRVLREGQPVWVTVPYAESSLCPRAAQPPGRLLHSLIQAAAHGAQPCVELSGTFEQDDRRALPAIKAIYHYLRDRSASYEHLVSPARVALLYSQTTADSRGQRGPASHCLAEHRGFYEALVVSHVQFALLHDGNLDADRLSAYDLLILPNVAAISDDQAAIIDAYVEAGGHLLASFETGLYDQDGQPRDVLCLGCLGRLSVDRLECEGGYLRILDRDLLPSLGNSDLLGVSGGLVVTAPLDNAGSQVTDLHLTPAGGNDAPEFAYSEQETDIPGLVLASFGAGEAAYLPWQVGRLYQDQGTPQYRRLILDLVRRWVAPLAATDAPGSVELTVHHPRGDGSRCLIHLLNATGLQGKPLTEPVPVHDISVWVRGPYVAARDLVAGREVPLTTEAGGVSFTMARLEGFAAIELIAAGASFAVSL